MDSQADCAELYKIRNNWDEDSPDRDRANQQLKQIKCISSAASSDYTPDDYQEFQSALDSGADCSQLFGIRNSWAEDFSFQETANGELSRVGSSSPSDTRGLSDGPQGRLSVDEGELASVTPSLACSASVNAAATRYNSASSSEFDELVRATLYSCQTAIEWFAATQVRPDSVGLKSADSVDDLALQIRCELAPDSPVCRDAEALGVRRL